MAIAHTGAVIVVTGGTGHVGGLVARELARQGRPMRLAAHTPSRVPDIDGAEVVPADYGDPTSLADALQEGDRVFMVSMHQGPDERLRLHRSFVETAIRQRVDYRAITGRDPLTIAQIIERLANEMPLRTI